VFVKSGGQPAVRANGYWCYGTFAAIGAGDRWRSLANACGVGKFASLSVLAEGRLRNSFIVELHRRASSSSLIGNHCLSMPELGVTVAG